MKDAKKLSREDLGIFFDELAGIIDKNIYFINEQHQILFTNDLNHNFNKTSEGQFGAVSKIPCYKYIFNLSVPCSYCNRSFTNNDKTSENPGKSQKRKVRVKNHFDAEISQQDFSLTQSMLFLQDESILVDVVETCQSESMYNGSASDQLTTLGAHVQTVAHELSNPITGLNLTRQQIVKILESKSVVNSSELKPLVDLLLKDIRRAAGVLSEIRNYSRPVTKSYKLVDLKSVIQSALDNVVRVNQVENLNLNFDWLIDENFLFQGNAAKLEQCFINIIKNSFEMFKQKKNLESPDIHIIAEKTANLGEVRIQIIDNAGGISDAALTNVFKPYFTTKERFRGLGLGLYIVGKILKEHNSAISIESRGEKTVVTIYMKQEVAP